MYSPYASTNLGSVGAPAVGNVAGLESVNLGPNQQPLTAANVRSVGQGRTFRGPQAFTTPLDLSVSNEATLMQRARAAQGQVQNILEPMGKRAQQVQQAITNNPGRYGMMAGALLPGIGTAVGELQAERPVGAAGAVVGGGVGAGIGYGVASMLPGGYGKVAKAVLPLIGGAIGAPSGAQGAEYAKRKITNQPTKGKEEELGSQLAAREQIFGQNLSQLERTLGVNTSNIKDLTQFYMTAEMEQMQKMNPLIQKMKNADMIRQQALMNTQASNYAMLGTVATAGRLATGAQAEAGANLRTALTSNPYAGSVMQAPNISFG
jgi:ribosomal protein S8E